MPMAMPISAFLIAGESLTPSPVTATMCPSLWLFSTMTSFCWGDVRANTIWGWARMWSQRYKEQSESRKEGVYNVKTV